MDEAGSSTTWLNIRRHEDPWLTVVMNELKAAMRGNNLEEFNRWLRAGTRSAQRIRSIVGLIEIASYNNRGPFIARLIEFDPAIKVKRPPSSAVVFALEYGNAHLIPLLTQIWPLPDDLPHAAGVGDFARVKGWFDEAGRPRLGSLASITPPTIPPHSGICIGSPQCAAHPGRCAWHGRA